MNGAACCSGYRSRMGAERQEEWDRGTLLGGDGYADPWRAGFAPGLLPAQHVERVVNAIERAVLVPTPQVVVHRASRRQVLRQRRPLATEIRAMMAMGTAATALRHFFGSTARVRRDRAVKAGRVVEEVQREIRRTIGRSAPNLVDTWRAWDLEESGHVSMVGCFFSGAIADLNMWSSVFDAFIFGGDFGGV